MKTFLISIPEKLSNQVDSYVSEHKKLVPRYSRNAFVGSAISEKLKDTTTEVTQEERTAIMTDTIKKMDDELDSYLTSTDYNTYKLIIPAGSSGDIPKVVVDLMLLWMDNKLYLNKRFDDVSTLLRNVFALTYNMMVSGTYEHPVCKNKLDELILHLQNASLGNYDLMEKIRDIIKRLIACIKGIDNDVRNSKENIEMTAEK